MINKYIFVLLLIFSLPSHALSFFTGKDLYVAGLAYKKDMNSLPMKGNDSFNSGLFMGYVSAAMDSSAGPDIGIYCPPDKGNLSMYSDIVFNYLDSHPERRTDPAKMIVIQAIQEKFHCKTPPDWLKKKFNN